MMRDRTKFSFKLLTINYKYYVYFVGKHNNLFQFKSNKCYVSLFTCVQGKNLLNVTIRLKKSLSSKWQEPYSKLYLQRAKKKGKRSFCNVIENYLKMWSSI